MRIGMNPGLISHVPEILFRLHENSTLVKQKGAQKIFKNMLKTIQEKSNIQTANLIQKTEIALKDTLKDFDDFKNKQKSV